MNLSVNQPATSIPRIPPTSSEAATTVPAVEISMPLYCVRKVAPQSRIVKRTTYMQKLDTARIQIRGLANTIRLTKDLNDFPDILSANEASEVLSSDFSSLSMSSISGSPTDDGVSFNVKNNATAPTRAMAAGTAKQSCHAL